MIERYRILIECMQEYLSHDDTTNALADAAFRIRQELVLGIIEDSEINNN